MPDDVSRKSVLGYRRLIAWQKSIELAETVLAALESFPPSQRYGLVPQLSRAVISISANLAEGSGHASLRSRRYYYLVARGSLNEVDSHLEIAVRRNWYPRDLIPRTYDLIHETASCIGGLLRATKPG